MRKPHLVYLLIALVVISSILAATLYFGMAQSLSVDVSGVISSDTTWSNINRPYNFTGNVFVNNGVTLTIEAGTTVYLNDHSLTVNGTLDARGRGDSKINFVSTPTLWSNEGVIVFLTGSTSWNEQTQTGSIIQYVVINASQPFPTIYIDGASPKISKSIIANLGPNVDALSGAIVIAGQPGSGSNAAPIISDNIIGNMLSGISDNGHAYISGNRIYDCSNGIQSNGEDTIIGNLFFNNGLGLAVGISASTQTLTIQDNTFLENEYGFQIEAGGTWTTTSNASTIETLNGFTNNNIESNIDNQYALGNNVFFDANYNWWGTSDSTAISDMLNNNVLSYYTTPNFGSGTFNFTPFLTEPNPAAPQKDYNPITSANLTPIPTENPSPSASSITNQSTTATPEQTNGSEQTTQSTTSTSQVVNIAQLPLVVFAMGTLMSITTAILTFQKR